ncbi:hypothetical protein [Fodinicola acaciae]|uniref:aspartate racemase/maleate isomerase family protein n=1 Tax=Fodinicola acaciae TaxID=2681555 RepID=UPI001C9E5209|nr:hypothetical protein [Fodinicola acaciae]
MENGRHYGIGVVAPHDFALDRELWRWTPENVSLYVTRIPYVAEPVTVGMATTISEPDVVARATRDLLTPRPSVVAYACTSGSFVAGVTGEQALRRVMLATGGPAAVTTSSALIDALQTLGIRRLAVLTPYVDSLTERLVDFLRGYGVRTTKSVSLGMLADIWTLPYQDIVRHVRALDTPEAEAIFVSCTNVATYDIIAPLERELGKPVLSANQVTMWAALRAAGLPAPRCGQLLFQPDVPSAAAPADAGARSLFRIRVRMPDETGKLAQLSQAVALSGGNILGFAIHPAEDESVVDELVVSCPETVEPSEICELLSATTGAPVHLAPADPHDLVDGPTRALELAAAVCAGETGVAAAFAALVHADDVSYQTASPPNPGAYVLVLPSPYQSGCFVARRAWAPFTPAEQARARSFAGLLAQVRDGVSI